MATRTTLRDRLAMSCDKDTAEAYMRLDPEWLNSIGAHTGDPGAKVVCSMEEARYRWADEMLRARKKKTPRPRFWNRF